MLVYDFPVKESGCRMHAHDIADKMVFRYRESGPG